MRAKKSLGQNFLRDEGVVNRIVDALDLRNDETVIEIGPGQGALTGVLLERAAHVVAIEFDRDMIALLETRFGNRSNFALIADDALQVDFADVRTGSGSHWVLHPRPRNPVATAPGSVKLVANLPYNISTPILQRLMEQRHIFSTIVLMFQREVVERITAKPGGKSRGFLSVLVENAFETEYLFEVPPTAFHPVPKVWSAVVGLTPKQSSVSDESLFREILSASFAQKRKTLLNNLKPRYKNAAVVLEKTQIDGRRRAETLTLEEWIRLTGEFSPVRG